MRPYGFVRRIGTPLTQGYYILHEGLLGVRGGDYASNQFTYAAMEKENPISATQRGRQLDAATGGWVGFTDKYWASAFIPDQKVPFDTSFTLDTPATGPKVYQATVTMPALSVAPGATAESASRLFVGAKEVRTLEAYQERYGIDRLNLLIDWGSAWYTTGIAAICPWHE